MGEASHPNVAAAAQVMLGAGCWRWRGAKMPVSRSPADTAKASPCLEGRCEMDPVAFKVFGELDG